MGHYLDEVHAGVERDRGHGACVVVRHLHGSVPLAAVTIQQHSDASPHQLIQRRNLLHVHCQFEGNVTQQGGGDVAGGPHPGGEEDEAGQMGGFALHGARDSVDEQRRPSKAVPHGPQPADFAQGVTASDLRSLLVEGALHHQLRPDLAATALELDRFGCRWAMGIPIGGVSAWPGQAADAARAADQVPVGHLTLETGCQLKGFQVGKKLTVSPDCYLAVIYPASSSAIKAQRREDLLFWHEEHFPDEPTHSIKDSSSRQLCSNS
ncbi:MAG: hypothetical protein FRX49_06312 [Trebouxia sp. A1-2]|nr:MAG: hypothetical protein FRX49_06312 [Trebouxia sp. A1-2]